MQDLAGTYLPHADVIVILGKADSLEFLKPEVLALPGLLDWWFAPHRFRIVLTHAHLLGTAMEYARTHPAEHVPLHDLRTHYLEQVRTHDFPADIAGTRCPTSCSHSSTARAGPIRRRAPAPTGRTRQLHRLHAAAEQPTALSSAEARLAQTYHAYRVAAAVPQRHYQQEQDALRDVEERARRITSRSPAGAIRQTCCASSATRTDTLCARPTSRSRHIRARRRTPNCAERCATPRATAGSTTSTASGPSPTRNSPRPSTPAGRLDGVGRAADRQRDPGSPRGRSGKKRGPRDHPTTLHDAGNAVRWAWRYQKILWIEFSPNGGNPGWATDEAVRVFEDGVPRLRTRVHEAGGSGEDRAPSLSSPPPHSRA